MKKAQFLTALDFESGAFRETFTEKWLELLSGMTQFGQ